MVSPGGLRRHRPTGRVIEERRKERRRKRPKKGGREKWKMKRRPNHSDLHNEE